MLVLVTGGAGYIGSHTLVELLGQGHEALVVDDFSMGSPVALDRVRLLTNRPVEVEEADVRDAPRLAAILTAWRPEAVIHFAGLKSVGEGERRPLDYHDVNVGGTLALLRAMDSDLDVEHGPERAVNGVVRRLADTGSAERDLGFRAEVGLEDGLRELVAWWRPLRSEIAAGRALDGSSS